MKIKIKNFNGELPDYLTVEKVYEVVKEMDIYGFATINTDDGYLCTVQLLSNSSRLNGGSWEIVNEKHKN